MNTLLAINHMQVDNCNIEATSYALGIPLTGVAGFVHGLLCDINEAVDAKLTDHETARFVLVIEELHRPLGHAKFVVGKRDWSNKNQIAASTIDRLTAQMTCTLYLELGGLRRSEEDAIQEMLLDSGRLAGSILRRRFCGGTTRLPSLPRQEYGDRNEAEHPAALRLLSSNAEALRKDMAATLPPHAYLIEDGHQEVKQFMEETGEDALEAMAHFLQRPSRKEEQYCRWFDDLASGDEDERALRSEIWAKCKGRGPKEEPAPGAWQGNGDDGDEAPKAEKLLQKLSTCIKNTYTFHSAYLDSRQGYHTLIAAGYHLLEEPVSRPHSRGNHPHAFSQPVMGLARLRRVGSISRKLEGLPVFWRASFIDPRVFLLRATSI